MKVVILLVILVLAFTNAKRQCGAYTCDTIDQVIPNKTICIAAPEFLPLEFKVELCPQGSTCDMGYLDEPKKTKEFHFCKKTTYEKNGWTFVTEAERALDGDYCETYKDCYQSRLNVALCKKNKCVSSQKTGYECDVGSRSRDCRRGDFCDVETRKCTPKVHLGSKCLDKEACSSGQLCINRHDLDRGFICTKASSLPNGVVFEESQFTRMPQDSPGENKDPETALYSLSFSCKSRAHYIITSSTTNRQALQCRQPPKNVNPSLTTEFPGEPCQVEIYNSPGEENYENQTIITRSSHCGFNQDRLARCPLQLGDDYAIQLYDRFFAKVNTLDCTEKFSNDPAYGVVCHDFYQEVLKGNGEDLFGLRRLQEIYDEGFEFPYMYGAKLWANTANNSQCVKDTITFDNWLGYGQNSPTNEILEISG